MIVQQLLFSLLLYPAGAQIDLGPVSVPGDIILGGLFPVHKKGERTACGTQIYHRGVQRLEAMMFAIDTINSNPDILPNITLGVHILDTCSRDTYALNQSLQFVRASVNNIDTSALECVDHSIPRPRNNYSGPVFGVVGGSYSSVSLQVANLLGLFHIPQISPASTAKALSDKSRFEYFARTVPPDTFQSSALVDIVKSVNWSYVSTIYSEGSYGEYGIEVFHREAQERNVCIATAEKVPSTADDQAFDNIIMKLKKKVNAKGVVLFTRAEDARRILQAAKRLNASHAFYWVASDGWGKQQKLVEGLEDVAEGAITVELQSDNIPGFDEYMMSLTPETNIRNPWFEQYWEDTFDCILEKNVPLVMNTNFNVCKPELRLSQKVGYEQESKVQFVVDAVYAFALALHNLYRDLCKDYRKSGVCPAMTQYDGGDFYKKYLLNVSFTDLAGSPVKFDHRGDGLARYDILNYQRLSNSSGYHYRVVGKWLYSLELDLDHLVWNNNQTIPPTSACSLPCEVGMIKKQQVILKCKIQDMSFLFSQLYNMVLITICTVYAVKTRKIPENFNESKFIGFTMYTTCIIWLAFIPIYFGTGNSYETQITTLCVATSMNATVALVCLYSPKVYIIVLHPDKNVRKLTMNSAAYKKYNSGPASTYTASSTHKGGDPSETIPMQNVGPNTPSRSSCTAATTEPASDSVALL